MTDPEALFKFLFKLPIWIVLFLVIGAIIKVLLESNSRVRKSNNIFRKIDIKDCHFQTLINILDSDQDYHEIVRISKDTLFYIDEYQAFLIMYKNWTGNLKGKASDEKWLIKSSQDYKVQNVLPRLKNIEEFVKEQLNIELQAIPSGFHSNGNINIAEINGIHSQLETWLSKFRGVSIRHFQEYLD